MLKIALSERKMKIEMNKVKISRIVRLAIMLAKKQSDTDYLCIFLNDCSTKIQTKIKLLKIMYFFYSTVLPLGVIFHITL